MPAVEEDAESGDGRNAAETTKAVQWVVFTNNTILKDDGGVKACIVHLFDSVQARSFLYMVQTTIN